MEGQDLGGARRSWGACVGFISVFSCMLKRAAGGSTTLVAASLLRGQRPCWGLHLLLLLTWASQNDFGYSIMEVLALLSSSAFTRAFWVRWVSVKG